MLGGLNPIIIFSFSQIVTNFNVFEEVPVADVENVTIFLPPIPIYLSETITGIYIDSEDKNVDIDTDLQTKIDGGTPDSAQKGISSTVSINLIAKKDSLGLTLLSSLIDFVFPKVTSKQYSIYYLHGATTIFGAVLHTFSINQNAQNDLATIKIELSAGTKNPSPVPQVQIIGSTQGAIPLGAK